MPGALPRDRHRVWQIEEGLLLVFKPRGHREDEHEHPWSQEILLLSGRLRVDRPRGRTELHPDRRRLRIGRGVAHRTLALADTWIVARRDLTAPASRRAPAGAAARRRRRE